jgi:hypothetical protein
LSDRTIALEAKVCYPYVSKYGRAFKSCVADALGGPGEDGTSIGDVSRRGLRMRPPPSQRLGAAFIIPGGTVVVARPQRPADLHFLRGLVDGCFLGCEGLPSLHFVAAYFPHNWKDAGVVKYLTDEKVYYPGVILAGRLTQ